jgi:hypothetical protein
MPEEVGPDVPWGARVLPGVDLRLWLLLVAISLLAGAVTSLWFLAIR